MYDDQDRPPWLRDLRPTQPDAKPEVEVESFPSAPTIAEPTFEPSPALIMDEEEEVTAARGPMSRQQMLILAILLWANMSILGCLCLLATGKVYL